MAKLIASWESIKREENRFRHYSLSLEEDLWGRELLVKRWGRIGHQKREHFYRPANYSDLIQKIEEIAGKRSKHGYHLEEGSLLVLLS